jgi:cell division protein FtsI/penicillin-binding protein 2
VGVFNTFTKVYLNFVKYETILYRACTLFSPVLRKFFLGVRSPMLCWPNSRKSLKAKEKNKETVISDNTCKILSEALSKTTIDGTGTAAQSHLYTCCSKTSTAQSGQYDENGKEINFCWFVGFFPKENPQYTICIMKENGSSGGSDCGPAFKEIAQALLFNF